MRNSQLPNFLGRRADIIHPPGETTKTLSDQLNRLGITAEVIWPAENHKVTDTDIVLFDSDLGYDGQFSWKPGAAPLPLIALMGSEAPGRIEWVLSQMPSAYLLKPIRSTGIFSAVAIAFHDFGIRQEMLNRIRKLDQRVKARPHVTKAIEIVQKHMNMETEGAYKLLRSEAMKHQVAVEILCERISTAGSLVPLKRGCFPESKET